MRTPLTTMASTSVPLSLSPPSPATQSHPPPPPPAISLPIPKNPTIRARLSKLCQDGQPHLARQLFDALPRPATVLWNTVIIGLICNNFPAEALELYAQMKRAAPSTRCDSYTFSATLKACAETRDLRLGRAVHCHVLRCLASPSRIVHNSLLNMYSVCLCEAGFGGNGGDLVRKVFDKMPKRNVVAWNTLVAWYVKTERYAEAFSEFARMLRARVRPSVVSFVNVFPAVSGLGDWRGAGAVYGLAAKMGGEYVNDLFVVSSGIFMFAELGCVGLARGVFDLCLERNTETWNTMIGCYVQNNLPAEAFELFLQAFQSEEAVLDEVTFLSALTAVSQLQGMDLAQQLHAYVIKDSRVTSVFIENAIIAMYSRCSSIDTSFKVFHQMVERDIVSWNTMVSALVHTGLDDEALMLVYEMQKQGFQIDSVTVTAILSAASNLRNPNIGKQTHGYLIRHRIEFEGMDSYLVDMYAKSGLVEDLQTIFEKGSSYDRDLATWNSIIAGYTQNGLIEEAFVVFRLMLEQNLVPNSVTLASVLPASSAMGNIDLGKQLHGFSVRHSLDQNVFVGTALIDMYSKSGAIAYAENVFKETTEKNSVTYTTMILGYGQHGMGERAVSLFYSMESSSISPDAITFVAVLTACSYCGLVDEGLQIFESMKEEYKIRPLIAHYCCVTDMLGRVGRVAEAYDFVKTLGEEGNVLEIWGSLLGACRIHEQFELGKVIAEKLLELDRGNGLTGYRVLLSNMYAEEGEWENVDRLRKQMRDKGLRKEVGCSWIDTSGCVNRFVSKDQNHHQRDEIYNMLGQLAKEMKASGYRPYPSYSLDGVAESDE